MIFIHKIKSISHGIFQNLRKLEVLDLCRNLIDHLDENTFSHCEKLRTLFFHKNDLELLPKNLFRNNKQLLYVNLSQHKLVHIPVKLFAHTSVGALMLGLNVCIDKTFIQGVDDPSILGDIEKGLAACDY